MKYILLLKPSTCLIFKFFLCLGLAITSLYPAHKPVSFAVLAAQEALVRDQIEQEQQRAMLSLDREMCSEIIGTQGSSTQSDFLAPRLALMKARLKTTNDQLSATVGQGAAIISRLSHENQDLQAEVQASLERYEHLYFFYGEGQNMLIQANQANEALKQQLNQVVWENQNLKQRAREAHDSAVANTEELRKRLRVITERLNSLTGQSPEAEFLPNDIDILQEKLNKIKKENCRLKREAEYAQADLIQARLQCQDLAQRLRNEDRFRAIEPHLQGLSNVNWSELMHDRIPTGNSPVLTPPNKLFPGNELSCDFDTVDICKPDK